jgi:asparagine synthetase B (glutamine-hydrolysing)
MTARFLLEHDARTGTLAVTAEGLHPPLRRHKAENRECLLLGHPIAEGQRDDAAVMRLFQSSADLESFARALDGNFLIVVHSPADKSLHVISDRFGAFAFYWSDRGNGRVAGSLSLVELVRHLGGVKLNENALAQFMHFRRVFGEVTADSRCQFLTSAGILSNGPGGTHVRKYWESDYAAPRLRGRQASDAIAAALRRTMSAHMEESATRRYALFLSGGLDSRALLAGSADRPFCVTTCASFNNEAEVAQDIARTANAGFEFVPRPATPYDGHIADAVYYGGGQHIVSEAHFLGYQSQIRHPADCFFLGLGLDVFLGGLYLAKKPARWLGRDTLHYKLQALPKDIAGAFSSGVKYRLATSDPWQVVAPSARQRLQDGIRHSLDEIAERGRALGADDHDLWEYLHLHNFGRHYSFLMIQSVRHWAECRVPALCNDLLDIAIRLPANEKLNSRAYLGALQQLAPELMKIRSANTNIRAGMPFRRQSVVRAARKAANALGGGFRVSPASAERSWPRPAQTLQGSPELSAAVAALPRSDHLAGTGLFDMTAIGRHVSDHHEGRRDHSVLLLVLVTMNEFLKQAS